MKSNTITIPKQLLILLFLVILLSIARIFIFNSSYFVYLLWNIFLACLPFVVSLFLLFHQRNGSLTKLLLVIGGIIWLLLLPNAPYIITDIIHIGRSQSVLTLYDTFLIFASAWVGLMLAFYSISHIEEILASRYTPKTTSFVITSILLVTSVGMYLGRFLRFNSWDVFSSHFLILNNAWSVFSQPSSNTDAYIFTGTSFIFLYISYKAWKSA